MQVCDSGLFYYGTSHRDLGEVLRDVPDIVCPACGDGAGRLGIFVAQEDDRVGNYDP